MNRKPLLLVAIVAAASLVLFFFLSKDEGDPKFSKKTAKNEVSTSAAPKRAGTSVSDNRGASREMHVRFDDDPEGSLRLEGQVISADELPVAGALVTLDSRPPRVATSSEDGSFFFEKLVARNYELVARSPSGVAGPLTARLSESNDPVILVLSAGGKVKVRVVSAAKPDGVEGARVQVRGLDMQEAQTDAQGVANFSQVILDRLEVSASAPGYAPKLQQVSLSRPGAQVDVRLELSRGAGVEGRVVDAEGAPVKDARVTYQGVSDWSVRANPRFDGVVSDREGRFKIAALPKGSFRLRAQADNMAPGDSEVLELDGQTPLQNVEVRMQASAVVRGMVKNRAGEPVPTASVRVTIKGGGPLRRGDEVRQAYSDEAGRYEITGLVRRAHSALAMHESASSQIVQADLSKAPHEVELDLVLDVDGTIEGLVVDTQGEPVAGAQVSAAPDFRKGKARGSADWQLRGFSQELTDAGGRFRIAGLESDDIYRVRALPASSASPARRWLAEGVQARAGDSELRIVLPSDGGISGKVAFTNGEAAELFTVSVSWSRGTPFSDEQGVFELGELPPDDSYTVTIAGPNFDEKRIAGIKVVEGELTDMGTVTVTQGRVISGRVRDQTGQAIEGAKVGVGRTIFGDGSSVEAAMQGNPMARATKYDSTDENGEFRISGATVGDLYIVADHETHGRSEPIRIQQNRDSLTGLDLKLSQVSSLRGRVTKGGQPVEGVFVTASPSQAVGATFNVASGPDGSYVFDRILPGRYQVRAMERGNPMRGMSQVAKLVDITSAPATLDIELHSDEGVTVTVALKAEGKIGFAWITVVKGAVGAATTARDLADLVGSSAGVQVNSMSIQGMPAQAPDLSPGSYSFCATVYPTEVSGMDGTIEYMNREGDNLPVFCQRAEVSMAADQTVTLEVSVPDFVPGSGE